jgi:choline dehydrogenase
MEERFDYIIVGGGTAGCVVANRLSASGRSVLVLEAGARSEALWVRIPAGFAKLMTSPRHNWRFQTEPEPFTENRVIAVPRGKGLGGSTLINGMIYVRGQPADFDGWAQSGCRGWSWDDVLPYFRRIEDWDSADPAGERGRGGPLPVCEVRERPELAEAFLRAAEAAGHRRNPDYNRSDQEGFGYYQVNQRNGRRISAADAYLRPALARPNLRVETEAHVLSLRFEEGRVTGVRARTRAGERTFHANREVVLTAGAVQTPHLLELSGIGDPDILRNAGIAVRHALPGVGANYIDHFCTRMNWRVRLPITLNETSRGLHLAKAVLEYFLLRKGILTLGTGLVHGFLRTRDGLEGPDVQFFFVHASYANAADRKLDRLPGMTIGVTQLRPESRGTIHLRSPDPFNPPAIRPNFLHSDEDKRCLVEGMKAARLIVEQAPLDPYRAEELNPGMQCLTDEDWLAFARSNGQTIYHVAGTCRMGPASDSRAVVDPELRLHGLSGLRIADASVMPSMVSGNTQAAVFMIAEKASDLLLGNEG